jgi:hypothetical protein
MLDEGLEISHQSRIRTAKVHMALPDGLPIALAVVDDRKRLRVVDYDKIVTFKVHARRIFGDHLLVQSLFCSRQIYFRSLQPIVNFLCEVEEFRRALEHAPPGLNARLIEQQRERGEYFGNAAAVVGRADIRDAVITEAMSFAPNALHCLRTDERPIVFDGMEP